MDLSLQDKTVLITGGSKGIGLACARTFAAEGARVVLAARDAGQLATAARELEGQGAAVAVAALDLSDSAAREELAGAHGDVDILVNNAGAIPGGSLLDIDMATWEEAWRLKVMGYIHLTRLYLERMQGRGGTIVNIIGTAGRAPRWDYICGSTGNAGLIAFTEAVGARSVDRNVRVFGINPSPTRTARIEAVGRARARATFGDESRWEEALGDLPFDRLAEPDEVAALAAMLASPRVAYVSGTVVDIDGGKLFRDG